MAINWYLERTLQYRGKAVCTERWQHWCDRNQMKAFLNDT